jgi:LysM repeat protein
VLEGGRSPAVQARQAVYRRRRVAVGLLAVALLALIVLAGAALAGIAGGVPSAAGSSAPPSAVDTVVVERGDTLWSIAEAVAPGVDPRITVDRLVERNGGAPLVVGQELEVPAG